jgi:hypothetical protein
MTTMPRLSFLASTMLLSLGPIVPTQAQQAPNMTFFVTSVGPGKGGGLAGADAYCHSPLSSALGASSSIRAIIRLDLRSLKRGSRTSPARSSGPTCGRPNRLSFSKGR